MTRPVLRLLRASPRVRGALAGAWLLVACAQAGAELPARVAQALQRAHLPRTALAAVVADTGSGRERLAWQADEPVNPASLTKLVTTQAALDLLGIGWRWSTPVWLDGEVRDGTLEGNLVLRGQGDPTLVMERLWLLLRRVRESGVHAIGGDIVIDRSAFDDAGADPAAFDGEPLKPYNVAPDALLVNYKALLLTFVPEPGAGRARVLASPPLAGVVVERSVPLGDAPCGDWQQVLRADLRDPTRVRFEGRYPVRCGERTWALAFPDPASYNARALAGLWAEMGGTLGGRVRDGAAPATPPSFEVLSPPLAEVVRDINKYSNNVMAQQLFLTLGLVQRGRGTPETGRAVVGEWLSARLGAAAAGAVIDNGSGLSRTTRLSARLLAQLLEQVWSGPTLPELAASLPVVGIDGTLRRAQSAALGRAHLKTGSLRDVAGVAGYVLGASGRRQVVVAIVNHPDASAARPALDALVQWAAQDAP